MNKKLIAIAVIFLTAFVFTGVARAGDLDQKLLEAVEHGNLEEVKRLISAGVNLSVGYDPYQDRYVQTPLIIAAEKGHLEIMQLLIESGSTNNYKNFIYFISKDHIDIVRQIIEKEGSGMINNKGEIYTTMYGYTPPITYASTSEMIALLVKHGADINANILETFDDVDEYSYPALINAVKRGSVNSIKALLKNGAKVDAKDSTGNTALMEIVSLYGEYPYAEIIKVLADNGADVNIKSEGGTTALERAMGHSNKQHSATMVRALLDNNVDISINKNGILSWAAGNNNKELTKVIKKKLIAKGDDANGIELLLAIADGKTDVVKSLLNKGTDINFTSSDSTTALMAARQNGTTDMLRLVIENGVDIGTTDSMGETILRHFVDEKNLDMVRLLIDAGADVNTGNIYGETPLASAIVQQYRNTDIIRLLVENGADVNAKVLFHREYSDDPFLLHSVLTYATGHGLIEMAKLFLDNGADVNPDGQDYWTPLYSALSEKHMDIVRLLIENGVEDEDGRALIHASEHGYTDIVHLLIKEGADVNAENRDDMTALDLASENGHTEIVKLLKAAKAEQEKRWNKGLENIRLEIGELKEKNFRSKYLRYGYDFSKPLTPKTNFIGYIEPNYRRLKVTFTSVSEDPENSEYYKVKGYSIVKGNKCDFEGFIRIVQVREYKSMHYGLDNEYKDQGIRSQGIMLAEYKLKEDKEQKYSGVFKGVMTLFWYVDKDNHINESSTMTFSDDYKNNQYIGTWSRYGRDSEKVANWGEYRVPYPGDLDIGAGEFGVNPKYYKEGWQDYQR